MSDSAHYVYGVVASRDAATFALTGESDRSSTDDGPTLEVTGVHGATELYPISHGRLAALASPIEVTEPEETDADAKRHDEVLRAVMLEGDGRAVVPMQFGMVFESERALKNVLRGGRGAFRRALRTVEGRVELGVKLVRERDVTVDDGAVEGVVTRDLDPLAESVVENDLYSDRLVVNRSYLVEQENQDAFDEAVADLEETFEDDLIVRYSGPFAPYNFVDVHVGAQR